MQSASKIPDKTKAKPGKNEMSLDWRMDKKNVIHLRNGVLYGRKKWHLEVHWQMDNLENMLSEETQTQKEKYRKYSLISGFQT